MKRRMFVCSIVLSLGLVLAPIPVLAGGIPVFDGTNLSQNILTAIRALQSNLNEARMIVNQVKQLENDLLNLTELDFSIGSEYSEQLHELFAEVGAVQGVMQDLVSLQNEFERLYPAFNNDPSAVASITMSEVLNEALNESRDMMLGAARTGAKVLENMPKTEAQLELLLNASESAAGNLSALQAGNQISATVSANLMSLNALMANYSQAHMSHLQKMNTEQAAVENRLQHVLRGIDAPPSSGRVGRNPF